MQIGTYRVELVAGVCDAGPLNFATEANNLSKHMSLCAFVCVCVCFIFVFLVFLELKVL